MKLIRLPHLPPPYSQACLMALFLDHCFLFFSYHRSQMSYAAAVVGARLDFCNSLRAGTSVSNLTRLQRVQNTFTRVVEQKPRFCHITPVLPDLPWLPVRHRISFKIAMVTFRVLQSQQPSYLASLIPRYCRKDKG